MRNELIAEVIPAVIKEFVLIEFSFRSSQPRKIEQFFVATQVCMCKKGNVCTTCLDLVPATLRRLIKRTIRG